MLYRTLYFTDPNMSASTQQLLEGCKFVLSARASDCDCTTEMYANALALKKLAN